MVQQRLKDYKPFKCSKIFHTHLKSQTSKKKGGGACCFYHYRKHEKTPSTAGASRLTLLTVSGRWRLFLCLLCAQVRLPSETHGGQRGAGAAWCSKPQPNGSCEAVYRIWAAKSLLRCERWLENDYLTEAPKNKHPSNTTTENEQKINRSSPRC